jgi:predicted acylesterase/phospholipase RssA
MEGVSMNTEKRRRALVLSGGGGRGAYHIGVLTYLQNAGWQPDTIVGTSIGAVNAAALGSGISLEGLRDRWLDLETGDVQKMRADDVFVDNLIMRRTHIFDTDPLADTLAGRVPKWQDRPWIDPDILNDDGSPYDVWITAVEAESRKLVYFHNQDGRGINVEMVRASCSIPLWYEPTRIGMHTYLDGGTRANTPFRKALELGAAEIVVVMMVPWPDRSAQSWLSGRSLSPLDDELLKIPQALWCAFEPALDMLLSEIAWKDYQLLQEERGNGKYPNLQWIRFVAPQVPLPTGNMTLYQRDNHVRLFRLGERNAREVLGDLMDDRDSRPDDRTVKPRLDGAD